MKPYAEPTPKEPPLLSLGYERVSGDVDCDLDRLGAWWKRTFAGHGTLVFLLLGLMVMLCTLAVLRGLGVVL